MLSHELFFLKKASMIGKADDFLKRGFFPQVLSNESQIYLKIFKMPPKSEGPLGLNSNNRHLNTSENPTWHILHSFRSPKFSLSSL